MKFKLGDIVEYKKSGLVGVVIQDPDFPDELVVKIHPYIYADIIEDDWKLKNVK